MTTRATTPPAAPAGQPVKIDAECWYTDPDLRIVLRVPGATLQRARRAGELRHTRRGNTTWHRGEWVIAWLSGQTAETGAADAR
jgi:hypothetical protein